MITVPFSAV
jgi:hypothetical protein